MACRTSSVDDVLVSRHYGCVVALHLPTNRPGPLRQTSDAASAGRLALDWVPFGDEIAGGVVHVVVALLGVFVRLALVGVCLPLEALRELRALVNVELQAPPSVGVEEHGIDRIDAIFHARVLRVDDHGKACFLQQGQVRLAGILATGVLAAGVWIDRNAVALEAHLDLLDHLRRVPYRVELIQHQRQTIAYDIHHRTHLHDVEVHANVQRVAALARLTGLRNRIGRRRLGMIINSSGLTFGALIQIPALLTNTVSFGHHTQ